MLRETMELGSSCAEHVQHDKGDTKKHQFSLILFMVGRSGFEPLKA